MKIIGHFDPWISVNLPMFDSKTRIFRQELPVPGRGAIWLALEVVKSP